MTQILLILAKNYTSSDGKLAPGTLEKRIFKKTFTD
jgi:hypothetical protein